MTGEKLRKRAQSILALAASDLRACDPAMVLYWVQDAAENLTALVEEFEGVLDGEDAVHDQPA